MTIFKVLNDGMWFQDLPLIPVTIIIIIFALLRMAAICRNPFDGTSSYDAHVKEEIDVQLFIGSLALFQDTPPKRPSPREQRRIVDIVEVQESSLADDPEQGNDMSVQLLVITQLDDRVSIQ